MMFDIRYSWRAATVYAIIIVFVAKKDAFQDVWNFSGTCGRRKMKKMKNDDTSRRLFTSHSFREKLCFARGEAQFSRKTVLRPQFFLRLPRRTVCPRRTDCMPRRTDCMPRRTNCRRMVFLLVVLLAGIGT